MSVDDTVADGTTDERKGTSYWFERHTAEYPGRFEEITQDLQANAPLAWPNR